jgi:hypothetical protein
MTARYVIKAVYEWDEFKRTVNLKKHMRDLTPGKETLCRFQNVT